jgi:hypothetical protein
VCVGDEIRGLATRPCEMSGLDSAIAGLIRRQVQRRALCLEAESLCYRLSFYMNRWSHLD